MGVGPLVVNRYFIEVELDFSRWPVKPGLGSSSNMRFAYPAWMAGRHLDGIFIPQLDPGFHVTAIERRHKSIAQFIYLGYI